MSLITVKLIDGVGTITLNDLKHLNALSSQFVEDIIKGIKEIDKPETRVVIIRAPKSVKVWSAGFDVKELPTSAKDPKTYNDPLSRIVRYIQTFPRPVIAMIEGSVWGGACELVMSCDILIASENSTFAITPAKLGVAYNVAGVLNFMKNTSLPVMREILFTAKPITAQRAREIGLINHTVPAEELENFTAELVNTIKNNAPLVISVMKEEMHVLSDAYPMNPEAFEKIQSGRRAVYNSKDYVEGIRSFFEKRKPVFIGE
jgi:methylmalonyl-CoA decarboxylase